MTSGWRRAYIENPALFHRFACAEDPSSEAWQSLLSHAKLKGKRVLEIGCGTGRFSKLIASESECAAFCACDREAAMLQFAESYCRGMSAEFLLADADNLPHPDNSFDRVFASWVLGFMSPNKRNKVLAEIERVLTPSGELWTFEDLSFAKSSACYPADLIHAIKSEFVFASREIAQATCDYLMGAEAPQFASERAPHHFAILRKTFV